jgi:hypothetical protein
VTRTHVSDRSKKHVQNFCEKASSKSSNLKSEVMKGYFLSVRKSLFDYVN